MAVILPKTFTAKINPLKGERAETCWLFRLTLTNNGQLPIKIYTELDINFLGLQVLKVWILIAEDPNQVLHKKTPDKGSWYYWLVIKLSYHAFVDGVLDLTQRELIHSSSPSYACHVIQMYAKTIHIGSKASSTSAFENKHPKGKWPVSKKPNEILVRKTEI